MNVKYMIIVMSVSLLIIGGCTTPHTNSTAYVTIPPTATTAPFTFVLVPKYLGSSYFDIANDGAQEAARELGVTVLYQGPSKPDAMEQIQVIDSLIAQKVDGLAISAIDSDALEPVCKLAIDAGIPVVSWDSEIAIGGRILHIKPAEWQDFLEVLAKMTSDIAGPDGGEFALLSPVPLSTGQGTWLDGIWHVFEKPEYSKLILVSRVYSDYEDTKSYNESVDLINDFPNIKVIIAPSDVGIAAAARAVTDMGLIGKVFVTGLGTPNSMRAYVKSGAVPQFALWRPDDMGYLAIYMLNALATGEITGREGETVKAGKLGFYTIKNEPYRNNLTVLLGPPFIWNIGNIDESFSQF